MTAGLGGMGGAQPLAATMNGATALVAEVDTERIDKRLATRYLDERIDDLDAAIDRALAERDARRPVSIGVRPTPSTSWSGCSPAASFRTF